MVDKEKTFVGHLYLSSMMMCGDVGGFFEMLMCILPEEVPKKVECLNQAPKMLQT